MHDIPSKPSPKIDIQIYREGESKLQIFPSSITFRWKTKCIHQPPITSLLVFYSKWHLNTTNVYNKSNLDTLENWSNFILLCLQVMYIAQLLFSYCCLCLWPNVLWKSDIYTLWIKWSRTFWNVSPRLCFNYKVETLVNRVEGEWHPLDCLVWPQILPFF